MKYDKDMDKECIKLCDAMNTIPKMRTTLSCCGHGRNTFRIWFEANDADGLTMLLNISRKYGWRCSSRDYGDGELRLRLESSEVGDIAYKQSRLIAQKIYKSLAQKYKSRIEREI